MRSVTASAVALASVEYSGDRNRASGRGWREERKRASQRLGARQGRSGQDRYLGPCPKAGSGPHRYVITLHAMKEAKLHTEAGASPTMMFADAMRDSLGSVTVTYTYSR